MKSIKKIDTKSCSRPCGYGHDQHAERGHPFAVHPRLGGRTGKDISQRWRIHSQLMLIGAIMGQLGIAMIILSRVLKYGINRWVNIVVGIVTIAYIWGGAASYPHTFSSPRSRLSVCLLIVWFAWTWRNVERLAGKCARYQIVRLINIVQKRR